MIRIVGQFLEDEKIIELYWVRDQRAITCSQQKYGAYCHKIAQNVLHNESDCEECMNIHGSGRGIPCRQSGRGYCRRF